MNIRNLSPIGYGLLHLVLAVLVIALPQLLTQNHVGDLTISAVVLGALNWAEQKLSKVGQ